MAKHADQGWGIAYGRFAAVVSRLDLRRGAEIGVAFGGHAESLLRSSQTDLLYGVDPYLHQPSYDDPTNLSQPEFDAMHAFTVRRLAPYGDRFRLVRELSRVAAAEMDGDLDYVYIDAVHTCAGVWDDLLAWAPLVVDGGVIGGHDYGHPDHPGVGLAVDEFCRRTSCELNEEGEGVWWTRVRGRLNAQSLGSFDCRRSLSDRLARFVRRGGA